MEISSAYKIQTQSKPITLNLLISIQSDIAIIVLNYIYLIEFESNIILFIP